MGANAKLTGLAPAKETEVEVNAKAEILKLKDGESWIWPESDYGKAEIWLKNGMLFLFEIPMFGGEPQFHDNYQRSRADDLVQAVLSWS